jgi:ABC-type spermidine/putrescine transport system permease subunit I
MRRGPLQAWLTFPAVALVALLVLPAVLMLVRLSLCLPARGAGFYQPGSFTLEHYARIFSGENLPLMGFTLAFACAVVPGVLLAAWLLVWPMRDWRGGRLLAGVLLLVAPRLAGMLAPLVVFKRLLPPGVLTAWLAEVYLITPYAALVLLMRLQAVDWSVLDAARGLGARSWQAFWRVAVPLALPGLWLAGQMALGWGLGAFLGPDILAGPEGRTLASDLHHQAFDNSRWPLAATEGVVLLGLVAAVFLARLPGRGGEAYP